MNCEQIKSVQKKTKLVSKGLRLKQRQEIYILLCIRLFRLKNQQN